ncbi:hypothetical protein D3C71_2121960 [compost metagenome]
MVQSIDWVMLPLTVVNPSAAITAPASGSSSPTVLRSAQMLEMDSEEEIDSSASLSS